MKIFDKNCSAVDLDFIAAIQSDVANNTQKLVLVHDEQDIPICGMIVSNTTRTVLDHSGSFHLITGSDYIELLD